jgi:hypothetical protein
VSIELLEFTEDPGPETSPRRGSKELIDDPSRVHGLLGALAGHGVRGIVRRASSIVGVRPLPSASEAPSDSMRWAIDSPQLGPSFVVEMVGYNSMYLVPIEEAAVDGQELVTPVPRRVLRLRRRWFRRQRLNQVRTIRFVDEASQTPIESTLFDVSYDGLSFWTEAFQALAVGQRIDDLEIEDPEFGPLRVDGEVRTVLSDAQTGRVFHGLVLRGSKGIVRWIDFAGAQVHPNTRQGSRFAASTWTLFDKCGYFHLSGKQPADFERLRRAYLSVSDQLDHAPHIGCAVAWPTPSGDVIATAAVLKVYRGTWLGLQMAKISGDAADGTSGRQILHEINARVYEHVQRDPEPAWFVTYIQVKPVWTRHIFHDFAQRYVASGLAAIVRFRALAVDLRKAWPEGTDEAAVDLASRDEIDLIARTILATRSRVYAEAFDLVEGRMDLGDNRRMWNGARFERARTVLVARKDGRAMAAAVLESAADGLHLFGLLDLVRLYSLTPGGDACFPTLLGGARLWFEQLGKDRFVCFAEDDTKLPDDLVETMEDMGAADMCIFAACRIPELLEYIYEMTAPKPSTPTRNVVPLR